MSNAVINDRMDVNEWLRKQLRPRLERRLSVAGSVLHLRSSCRG